MVLHAAAMNLRPLSFFFAASFVSFSVAGLAGCAADTSGTSANADDAEELAASEDAITAGSSNFGYFAVTRRDFRKCMSPICGGFYVKRVNQPTTDCADGSKQAECYVSAIQLSGIGLSAREEEELRAAVESGKALIKARVYKTKLGGTFYGKLKANEGWLGATGSAPEGTFYRVADNGIRCIKAPCPSTTAAQLNGHDDHDVIKVNLEGTATPADQATLDLAAQALGTKDGILIAGGIALPKCMPGSDCGPFATATEFYLRVTPREGKGCGFWGTYACNAGQYCNWKAEDICGAADAAGVCSYKPQVCNKMYAPVCACDGKTYGNACMAAAAGASVSSQGECAPPPNK
jgi:hypothetical protein